MAALQPTIRQTIEWGWAHEKPWVILTALNVGGALGHLPIDIFIAACLAVISMLMLLVLRGDARAYALESLIRFQDTVLREMRKREEEREQG